MKIHASTYLATLAICATLSYTGCKSVVETHDENPSQASSVASWQFPCDEAAIKQYTALRVTEKPVIDGRLDETFWRKIEKSPRFTDLVTGDSTVHNTQAAVAWDDENLYIAFWVEEPFVEAKLTNHNDLIYTENDVEVFIAAKNAYYEYEMNALNTRYEVFFMWKDQMVAHGFDTIPNLSVSNPKVRDFNGVAFSKHPRGMRVGSWDYKFEGMQSGVFVDGTINNNTDRDRGWTVELAFPWKSMDWLMRGDDRAYPPKNNDVWRIDFTRFNTYKTAAPANDSGGWAWSPHGAWDSHIPECFPKIIFSAEVLK